MLLCRRSAVKAAPCLPSWLASSSTTPLVVLVAIALGALPARGQGDDDGARSLGRDDVIEHARARAPDVLRALEQLRVVHAEAPRSERLSLRNPSVQASVGPRFGPNITPDVDLSAWLPLPLLVDRARAMTVTRAHVKAAEIDVEAVRLVAVGTALEIYLQVLYAKERVALARQRAALAERLLGAASTRFETGDASRLELVLAEAERAASLAGVLAAEATLEDDVGLLAFALGLPALRPEEVHGRLQDQIAQPAAADEVEPLLARALRERADLRAAEATLEAARADVELAAIGWLPELSLGAGYGLEEGTHITTVGVSVTLPVFDAGQGAYAEASAAERREERELELLRLAAAVEITRAFAVHQKALAAARLLQTEALPRAAEAEELVAASYSAGKIDLAALLMVLRDALTIRAEHLARQLEAARAAIRLSVVAGQPTTTNASDLQPAAHTTPTPVSALSATSKEIP